MSRNPPNRNNQSLQPRGSNWYPTLPNSTDPAVREALRVAFDYIYQLRARTPKEAIEDSIAAGIDDIAPISNDLPPEIESPCQSQRFQLLSRLQLDIFDCTTTVVQFPYAYVFGNLQSGVVDPCLIVINIRDTDNPFLVSTLSVTAVIENAVLIGNILIGTDGSSNFLWTFDMGDPGFPTEIGSIDVGHQAKDIAAQGRYVYVIGSDDLSIVDYSNWAAPTVVDNNNDASWNLRAIVVDNWYAYIADFTGEDLRIFDVTSGASSLVSTTALSIVAPRGILYSQGYCFICGGDDARLQIFDVKDVSTPLSVGTLNNDTDTEAFWDNLALAGDLLILTGDGDMYGVDVSDVQNPKIILTYDAGPSFTQSFYKGMVSGRNFFIAGLGTVAGEEYVFNIFRIGGFFCDYINTSEIRVDGLLEGLDIKAQHANFAQDVVAGSLTVTGEQGGLATSRKSFLTFNDFISDDGSNGLVLKDTQATPHYWRVTVSNVGALVITDIGTTRPAN
jgi:hypothetical protein